MVDSDIARPRDVAVRLYSEWQQSKAVDKTLKTNFQNVYNVMLNDGLDPEQLHEDQDPGFFFIHCGVISDSDFGVVSSPVR
jgi:hypothetical protein